MTLSRDLPGDVFARFMSDTSSTADEARVVQALAKPHFLAALAGTLTAPRHLSAPLTS
ncbi:MAG: hypothetical protein JHD16_06695 [Solirubrobacteraceae bacterium]|nr:hypothetical protein [Solirubrobacteraceae bacterium]